MGLAARAAGKRAGVPPLPETAAAALAARRPRAPPWWPRDLPHPHALARGGFRFRRLRRCGSRSAYSRGHYEAAR